MEQEVGYTEMKLQGEVWKTEIKVKGVGDIN